MNVAVENNNNNQAWLVWLFDGIQFSSGQNTLPSMTHAHQISAFAYSRPVCVYVALYPGCYIRGQIMIEWIRRERKHKRWWWRRWWVRPNFKHAHTYRHYGDGQTSQNHINSTPSDRLADTSNMCRLVESRVKLIAIEEDNNNNKTKKIIISRKHTEWLEHLSQGARAN